MSELIVENDLLRRNLNVLRPLVVSRYDLMADDGHRTYRVQVKTGRLDGRQSPPTLKASWDEHYDPTDVDVIAVVDSDTEMVYYVKTVDLPAPSSSVTIRFDRASRETSAFEANACMAWPYEMEEE